MTGEEPDGDSAPSRDWQRKRYLAEVFGEILPETTSDDRAPGTTDGRRGDVWYRDNRPPHHDAG